MLALALSFVLNAAPVPTETWGCATHGSIVEHHNARLELKSDATFRLRHTNSSEYAGTTTTIDGTWTRADGELVLTPTSGDRTFWQGDAHRFQHGETTRFCQWREPLMGGERRLREHDVDGIAQLTIPELKTALFRDTSRKCADVRPSPSPSKGYRCETPKR